MRADSLATRELIAVAFLAAGATDGDVNRGLRETWLVSDRKDELLAVRTASSIDCQLSEELWCIVISQVVAASAKLKGRGSMHDAIVEFDTVIARPFPMRRNGV